MLLQLLSAIQDALILNKWAHNATSTTVTPINRLSLSSSLIWEIVLTMANLLNELILLFGAIHLRIRIPLRNIYTFWRKIIINIIGSHDHGVLIIRIIQLHHIHLIYIHQCILIGVKLFLAIWRFICIIQLLITQ